MKKIIFILFLTIFMNTNLTFAQPSEPLVYCSDKVECPSSGNVNLCHVAAEKQPYVDSIVSINGVIAGDYNFNGADANYHYQYPHVPIVSGAVCHYQKGSSYIDVYYKKESNIEVYYDNSTKWDISGHLKLNEPDAFCVSSNPSLCPMSTKPELVIKVGGSISTTIKDLIQDPNHPQQFLTINYNEALTACGNTDKCEIKVTILKSIPSERDIPGGSVVVSTINEMRIISVIDPPYNYVCGPDGTCPNVNIYALRAMSPFNTIVVASR